MPRQPQFDPPEEVKLIRRELDAALNATDAEGRKVGNATRGVYAFYDYDGEPIYVGQTMERMRTRIRRHLTNQRTDAVAMNVLDPFEVAEIEMWPLWDLQGKKKSDPEVKAILPAAEYTAYQRLVAASQFGAMLNEKDIAPAKPIELPESIRRRIIPDSIYTLRKHPDTRIARRASTIAALARVISERQVSKGLRRTLVTQARRLERLAGDRLGEVPGAIPVEQPGEETGENVEPE